MHKGTKLDVVNKKGDHSLRKLNLNCKKSQRRIVVRGNHSMTKLMKSKFDELIKISLCRCTIKKKFKFPKFYFRVKEECG